MFYQLNLLITSITLKKKNKFVVAKGSAVIEVGAQWVHGHDNIVYDLAAPEGLLNNDIETQESTGYSDNVVVAYTGSGKKVSRTQWKEFHDVIDDIDTTGVTDLAESTMSLGDYFIQK